MEANKIAGQKLGAWGWGWSGGKGRWGERREKGRIGGVEWLRLRKGGYGSREEDTLIKGVILGLARDLALEGFPGVQGDVPS